MFATRNACAMLAMLALSACGSGGSDSPSVADSAAGSNGTGSSATGNESGTATGTGTASSGTLLKLVASQVLFSNTAFTLNQVQGASGAGPAARTQFSPVTAFGFRPQANNRPTARGAVVHTSLLLSMKQRTAEVLPGQVPQVFQFEFDAVDMVVSADHDVVKVSFPAGARAWAYYRDSFGATVLGSSTALSEDLISLQPIADDTTSDLLSFSIDPLMRDIVNNSVPTAQSTWNGIAPMHGTFDTSVVIGNTSMETDAFAPLPSTSIAFGGGALPAVSGSLLAGALQVAAEQAKVRP
jgi:hypothetical protein